VRRQAPAHLDGIASAGDFGAQPADAGLESPGTGELFVATVGTIQAGNSARLDKLLSLAEASHDAQEGLLSAFGWVSAHSLKGTVGELLRAEAPFRKRVAVRSGSAGSGLAAPHFQRILSIMSRPLRIELSGGLYHVTSRGDRQEDIYLNDEDRVAWLDSLGAVCKRFNWACHAWCQMTNHYHAVIETPGGNLSQGMRQLNGVYTQYGCIVPASKSALRALLAAIKAQKTPIGLLVHSEGMNADKLEAMKGWQNAA
jgi:REP element-mobilizing transposase RayT